MGSEEGVFGPVAGHNTETYGECFHFDYAFWENPIRYGMIDLFQIGEVCSESGFEMQRHVQECNEISYVVSGSGYAHIDGKVIHLREGDILTCSTNHEHMMVADTYSTMRFLYMGYSFAPDARSVWGDMVDLFNNRPYTLVRDDHTVRYPFVKGLDEFFANRACSQRMIQCYCEQILILTYRLMQQEEEKVELLPRTESAAGAIVYTAIRYIEKHILEIENVTDLSSVLGYSHSYVSHIFKERTGMTLQRYIVIKKHEKALEMLRMGSLSVTEVARMLNYKTIQAFSKSFTRTMGFSPSRYDKVMQKDMTNA